MDFPQLWESEFIGDRGEYFHDGEWSFSFGSELGIRKGPFQVLSLKPYLRSFLERLEILPSPAFMVCLVRSWVAKASFLMARREFR